MTNQDSIFTSLNKRDLKVMRQGGGGGVVSYWGGGLAATFLDNVAKYLKLIPRFKFIFFLLIVGLPFQE